MLPPCFRHSRSMMRSTPGGARAAAGARGRAAEPAAEGGGREARGEPLPDPHHRAAGEAGAPAALAQLHAVPRLLQGRLALHGRRLALGRRPDGQPRQGEDAGARRRWARRRARDARTAGAHARGLCGDRARGRAVSGGASPAAGKAGRAG
eukprot:966260-Rhodomonas_salina.1